MTLPRTLEYKRSVGSDQDGTGTGSTSGTGGTLGVDRDVTAEDDGVAAVPAAGLDPVDGVEEGGGRTVAGILGVDALNVRVAIALEKRHQDGLDRLGLIDDGLGSNIETSDRLRVDIVLLEEARDG